MRNLSDSHFKVKEMKASEGNREISILGFKKVQVVDVNAFLEKRPAKWNSSPWKGRDRTDDLSE